MRKRRPARYNVGAMGKRALRLTIALLFLSVLACAGGPEPLALRMESWDRSVSVPLDPGDAELGPRLDVYMSLLWVVGPAAQAAFLNGFLYPSGDGEAHRGAAVAELREARRRMAEGGDPAADRDWRHAETVRVAALGPGGGLMVTRDLETFFGFEGLGRRFYYVFDLNSPGRVRLDDLFSDFQGDEARGLVHEGLRALKGLGEGEPLSLAGFLSDEPELTFNFSVGEGGLGLRWNPGEIAPRSMGGVDLVLPWRAALPALRASGAERLRALFGLEL